MLHKIISCQHTLFKRYFNFHNLWFWSIHNTLSKTYLEIKILIFIYANIDKCLVFCVITYHFLNTTHHFNILKKGYKISLQLKHNSWLNQNTLGLNVQVNLLICSPTHNRYLIHKNLVSFTLHIYTKATMCHSI